LFLKCYFSLLLYICLQENDSSLYRPSLEILRTKIRSSTASITSVPKPLKFLRPHYATLKEVHEKMPDGENKASLRFVAIFVLIHSGVYPFVLKIIYMSWLIDAGIFINALHVQALRVCSGTTIVYHVH